MADKGKKKRPRDVNALAKSIADEATGTGPGADEKEQPRADESSKAEAGRMGGLKGGAARALRLSAEERREIARKAALARWRRSK